jgi:hypothetical protein
MTNQDAGPDRPPDDADWVAAAAAAFERWHAAGDMKQLSKAAGILAGAARRMLVDPERTTLAARIAEALLEVSVAQARPDIVDYAIGILERETALVAGELDPRGIAQLATCHAALLVERFYLSGRIEDLAAALALYEANAGFVEAVPDVFDTHDLAWFWWGFGKARWHKFDIAPNRLELLATASCLDKALAAQPADSAFGRQIRADRAVVQGELVLADFEAQAAGNLADATPGLRAALDDAIAALQGFASSDRASGESRQLQQNLANLLVSRSRLRAEEDPQRAADLQQARAACDAGLALRAASEWERVMLLATRADCLRLLAGNRIDASLESAYVDAVECARRTAHPEMLPVASNWQRLLGDAGRWQESADVGDVALSLLDRLVDDQPHQHYKQAYLRRGLGLADATAVAHARAGDAAGAVASLERTLAVVWRERYFGPRSLANRLRAAGAQELAAQYLDLIAKARATRAQDAQLRQVEGDLAQLRASIDEILAATGGADPGAAACEGAPNRPCLYLVTAQGGSLALLRDSEGLVAAIDLPLASAAAVHAMSERFRRDVVSGEAEVGQAFATAAETVAALGPAALAPIEGRLRELLADDEEDAGDSTDAARAPPTLALVAVGPFAGLPLHAARLADGRPAAALGLACVPTMEAQDEPAPRLDLAVSVLIVADPASREMPALDGAAEELGALAGIWPQARVLREAEATRPAVLAALPEASLIHLACHGMSDDRDPLDSRLVLADGDLTMADVMALQLRPGCLVVLSACQTAVRDPSVPNEAMSLAMGFLAAGAATVVASLWPVPDYSTAALMGAFHAGLRRGLPPAHALGAAQAAMAAGDLADASGDADWRHPFFWAGFVATGR